MKKSKKTNEKNKIQKFDQMFEHHLNDRDDQIDFIVTHIDELNDDEIEYIYNHIEAKLGLL